LGAINLHASLLPKYRGAAPINWALYHGERETGVTVFHITPKVDSGPILAQEATPIDPSEDAIRLERRLSQLGVGAVRRSIERLAAWDRQSPLGAAQDPRSATKAPRLKKEHGFVDWTRSAQQIANQVRALKPWPSTYTVLRRPEGDELRLILDQVSVVEEAAGTSGPGEVVQVDKRRLLVATGNGLLSIERIQPAGKRCMGTDEFLRGHAIQPGQNLASPADT
jgi:methionyl-tRNA formyltransferase